MGEVAWCYIFSTAMWYYDIMNTHIYLLTMNWLQSFLVCCEITFTVNIVPFLLLWTMFYMLSCLGVHPSCLYSQSRVNPATTNQCPCRVVTKPLTEDDIQLQWLERVAVGLGLGTIHRWMCMVRGSQMQSPTSTCARMQQGPSASSTSSATGQFSWCKFNVKSQSLI